MVKDRKMKEEIVVALNNKSLIRKIVERMWEEINVEGSHLGYNM